MIEYVKRYQKLLFGIFLGLITCFFAVSIAAPSQSINPTTNSVNIQLLSNEASSIIYQQQAESVLIAQASMSSQGSSLKRFVAVLSSNDVVPTPSMETFATGAVGAALNGNRLVVRGDFRGLSSPLRDYATDPVSPPNPNITSGIHMHRGTPKENGPFQNTLEVQAEPNGLNGRVKGEFTLTDEQLQALNNGTLYIDIHTKSFRAGELRGVLKSI